MMTIKAIFVFLIMFASFWSGFIICYFTLKGDTDEEGD